MTSATQPLISCLCLTRKRPHYLARAIRCFLAQTYENKELIVVYPKNDEATAECLKSFQSDLIRPHGISIPGATLGELRNVSIECARGEYLCGWDDDDWHNPDRLSRQYDAVVSSKKSASLLARMFLYDTSRERAYLSCERLWENSVFFSKKDIAALGIRYPHLNKSEDYEFVNELVKHNLVYPVYDATSYIYTITGANTCDSSHFGIIFKRSSMLTDRQTEVVKQAVDLARSPLDAYADMESRGFKETITYIRHSPHMPRY